MEIIERRLQALEQENAARKQTEELLTISVRALASKDAFEKLQRTVEEDQKTFKETQERDGKLFQTLINQGTLHREQLADLQGQIIGLQEQVNEGKSRIIAVDGKVVGLQTEMRQQFAAIDKRFAEQDNKITTIQADVSGLKTDVSDLKTDVSSLKTDVSGLKTDVSGLKMDVSDLKSIAQQILARLPEKP